MGCPSLLCVAGQRRCRQSRRGSRRPPRMASLEDRVQSQSVWPLIMGMSRMRLLLLLPLVLGREVKPQEERQYLYPHYTEVTTSWLSLHTIVFILSLYLPPLFLYLTSSTLSSCIPTSHTMVILKRQLTQCSKLWSMPPWLYIQFYSYYFAYH